MEIILFAAIAGFILFRLYKVLGQDVGFKPGATTELETQEPVSRTYAKKFKPTDDVSSKIQEVQKIDPHFDLSDFLGGASHAFGMILDAFNKGDRDVLKSLLEPKLYLIFEKAISTREKNKETWDNTLIRIQRTDCVDIAIEKKTQVFITVKFVSDQILVTNDASGNVIEGDHDQIEVITDLWTFTRNVQSEDPNWMLIKTAVPD